MKKNILGLIYLGPLLFSTSMFAEGIVLSDVEFFKQLGAPIVQSHSRLNMAYGDLSGISEERLHQAAHELGRCGGFEKLGSSIQAQSLDIDKDLKKLEKKLSADKKWLLKRAKNPEDFSTKSVPFRPEVKKLIDQVSAEKLKEMVLWMQGFGSRSHRASQPNRPVEALKQKLVGLMASSKVPYKIEEITHSRTNQNSIKLSLVGSKEPQKKIILGAHFDSISGWGSRTAPGADDNASGSSNLIEVARILSQYKAPEKTIEFFWYAGEEGGLIGSAEIASGYEREGQDVVAVMQLDMTLYPGDGAFILGSVTDFTTPWVRELLGELNQTYFQFQINDFECGYGCSDHASWYRRGFDTVAPFEARMRSMNPDIHTSRDEVKSSYNFDHSAAFSKLALTFVLELDQR